MVSAIVCAGLNSPSYSFENHKYQKYAFSSSSPLLQDIYDNLYSSPNPYSFNLFFATLIISSFEDVNVSISSNEYPSSILKLVNLLVFASMFICNFGVFITYVISS